MSRDYVSNKNDYFLFTKGSGDFVMVLGVYVDDILLASSDVTKMKALKSFIDEQFKIKDLGDVHYFLGLEVHHTSQGYLVN